MKKPKGVRSVKLVGVSLEDIFAKDARTLDTITLKAYTQKLVSAYNKRLKRLEQSGYAKQSPAYKYLRGGETHTGKVTRLSTKIRDPYYKREKERGVNYYRDKYLKIFAEAKSFLDDRKTSSIKGVKEMMKELEKRLPDYYSLKKSQRKDFWDAYNRLLTTKEGEIISKNGQEGGVLTSSQAQQILYDDMFGDDPMDAETAIFFMRQRLEDKYSELKEREAKTYENPLNTPIGNDEEGDEDNVNNKWR